MNPTVDDQAEMARIVEAIVGASPSIPKRPDIPEKGLRHTCSAVIAVGGLQFLVVADPIPQDVAG